MGRYSSFGPRRSREMAGRSREIWREEWCSGGGRVSRPTNGLVRVRVRVRVRVKVRVRVRVRVRGRVRVRVRVRVSVSVRVRVRVGVKS